MAPTGALAGYRTKADMVFAYLREGIVSGQFPPGTRIVLDQIATQLGVSKVPIREAVDRLVGEGWLETNPHVGPIVPVLRPGEVHETALIRTALETAAIEHAITRHAQASLARMHDLLDRMATALRDPSLDFPRLNLELHAAIIEPCPYRQLYTMSVGMMERTLRYQTVHRVAGYDHAAHDEHVAIVHAIENGDTARAVDLTRTHIMSAAVKLEQTLTENSERVT